MCAQFGNTRAVIELASVANQLGRKRTLCEAYGGAGWETRLEDMKRIGDWLYVLGVNTMNEHLSRISMRGARKADYPPSSLLLPQPVVGGLPRPGGLLHAPLGGAVERAAGQ